MIPSSPAEAASTVVRSRATLSPVLEITIQLLRGTMPGSLPGDWLHKHCAMLNLERSGSWAWLVPSKASLRDSPVCECCCVCGNKCVRVLVCTYQCPVFTVGSSIGLELCNWKEKQQKMSIKLACNVISHESIINSIQLLLTAYRYFFFFAAFCWRFLRTRDRSMETKHCHSQKHKLI